MEYFICQYCGKECKNLNSLKQHEIRCKLNPNKINVKSNDNLNKYREEVKLGIRKASNQYIKAKELGLPKPIISEETRIKIGNGWRGKKHSQETKEKIKTQVQKNIQNGDWHLSFSKSKIKEYKGIKFLGSWEYEFAKYLDSKNIEWIRPSKMFKYIFENENHRYLPDFYLPKYNLYIEIKGYPTSKDFAKWEQFQENLDIYFGDDLYNLGIINSYRDKYQLVDKKFRIKHINL